MKFTLKLLEFVKTLDGNILVIGIDDEKILENLSNNNKITEVFLLSEAIKDRKLTKDELKNKIKLKTVEIQKLRKSFKKTDLNYTIYNFNEIKKYIRFVIRDSACITKKCIYIYGVTDEYGISSIIKKYKRYNVDTELSKIDDEFILKIYTANLKYNFIKEIFYRFIDFWVNIFDMIGDGLIN